MGDIPEDYPLRVKDLRGRLGLTQAQMAERVGVSFATVNRWENSQSRPGRLAWRGIVDLEAEVRHLTRPAEPPAASATPTLDFGSEPAAVAAVAAATRLAYGHLSNPAFASEISSIDPLPHQRIAVYEHMIGQSPLRFLLADDAGAGKTIMTGLYLREMLVRRLITRVLVAAPAGLVGNWEREMRMLFRLPFRIVRGTDARAGNPFAGPGSDRIVVSIDTLVGERMFGRLREAMESGAARPYDLVVFDEAHKLAAAREQDFRVRKTDRYRLAEALAGLPVDCARWRLGWSAPNILLLTATPHMGKDFPYYCLWRLLAPDALATFEAFADFPEAQRRRHFIRRTRLDEAVALVRAGRSEELERGQTRLGKTPDFFESRTADEEADDSGERERHEEFEEAALGGFAALTLTQLREERAEVEVLLFQARRLAEAGEDSKFEKLRAVMGDPAFAREKLIVFTEHRDTAAFLVRRLEGLGFAGRVALVHGGLDYRAREAQVELFRRPAERGGASYLVATDAAGEGINLQFCWLMVNYDLPWNPARLEQRMGRIHRYGQTRDPVVIVNLVAGETREGRVLKVLLDKLEAIRKELRSDKVFDVVGHLFENLPLKDYLEQAVTEAGARAAVEAFEANLTPERAVAIEARERGLYGSGEVRARLPELNATMEREQYRRLLPGHVRHFVETAAPLIDLRLEGDAGGVFDFVPQRPRAADDMRAAMDVYPEAMRGRLTFQRPESGGDTIWMHPGEPVFECFHAALLARHGGEALRGAIFVDPHAEEPYLFHLARVSVVRRGRNRVETVEIRPVGLRQESDGAVSPCPPEHLLLLRGIGGVAPGSIPLARAAHRLTENARASLKETALRMAAKHRVRLEEALPERRRWTARGYDYKTAELMTRRRSMSGEARQGDSQAQAELAIVKEEQNRLVAEQRCHLAALEAEPASIGPGEAAMIAHALVLPTGDPEERQRHDAEVEAIAMAHARAHEEAAGASVRDVSRPALARRAGLGDWPGFDLRSLRPAGAGGPAEDRAIEVKGRAGSGAVEVSENEWAAACNLRERYWLYVVFDCAGPRPRLVRVRDPFGRLLARTKGGVVISASEILSASTDERVA